MQFAHDTDIVAARPIDRDDGFDGQLVFVAHVDDTAGRSLLAVEDGDLRGEVPAVKHAKIATISVRSIHLLQLHDTR